MRLQTTSTRVIAVLGIGLLSGCVAPGSGPAQPALPYQAIRWLNGALVIDLAQGKVVDRVALGEPQFAQEGKDAHGPAVAPDGRELWLTTQTTNTVTVIDTGTHEVLARFAVGRDPNWVGFTPDGRLAVVSNTGSGDASVVDVRRRLLVATVTVGSSPKRLAVGTVRVGD